MPHVPGAGSVIINLAERLNHELVGDRAPVVSTAIGAAAGVVAMSVDPVGTVVAFVRRVAE